MISLNITFYTLNIGIFPMLLIIVTNKMKERKKSLSKRAFKGHRVLSGYAALYWRGGSLVEGNL
jgi:hypothetical protein